MKKYIVKETSYATEANDNFKGQMGIYYFGKGSVVIAREGSHPDAIYTTKKLDNYMIKEYGYDRLCDAKKSYVYKHPENTKYWKSVGEIIEVEIE